MVSSFVWVATLSSGERIFEFDGMGPQKSFDSVRDLDITSLVLCPIRECDPIITILRLPDEYIEKKWVRTFDVVDGTQSERPVYDVFVLHSTRPVYHHLTCTSEGQMQIFVSTNPEPPL